MRLTNLSLFSVACAILAASDGAWAGNVREPAPHAAKGSVVKLVSISDDGRHFFGSGVVLHGERVVTNCHVTRIARTIKVLHAGRQWYARAHKADVKRDLCLLEVPRLEAVPSEIGSTSALRVGDKVYAVGQSSFESMIRSTGEVNAAYQFDGGKLIESSAPFPHGASGGGLFDGEGRLLGVLTFYRTSDAMPPSYFAIPIEWLDHMVEIASAPIGPLQGVPFWAEPLERQPVFLQAGALEAAEMWEEMRRVAEAWTRSHPEEPQAWVALGKAAQKTGHDDGVAIALSRLGRLAIRNSSSHVIDLRGLGQEGAGVGPE